MEWNWKSCLSYCCTSILRFNCSWYLMVRWKPCSVLPFCSRNRNSTQPNYHHSLVGTPCCYHLRIPIGISLWKHIFVTIYHTRELHHQLLKDSGKHICTCAQEGKYSFLIHPTHSAQITGKCTNLNCILHFQLKSYK